MTDCSQLRTRTAYLLLLAKTESRHFGHHCTRQSQSTFEKGLPYALLRSDTIRPATSFLRSCRKLSSHRLRPRIPLTGLGRTLLRCSSAAAASFSLPMVEPVTVNFLERNLRV